MSRLQKCAIKGCKNYEDTKYKNGEYKNNVFMYVILCTEHLEIAENNFKKDHEKREKQFKKKIDKKIDKIKREYSLKE